MLAWAADEEEKARYFREWEAKNGPATLERLQQFGQSSSDDDEVQFTGTLDADAARERDRAAAEASGNAFDLCTQESQGEDTEAGYMAYFAGRRGSPAAASKPAETRIICGCQLRASGSTTRSKACAYSASPIPASGHAMLTV